MDRLENVATPPTATTVVVPDSVPPPGLAPIATLMSAVDLVSVLPKASCTATWTAGEMLAPAVALLGWTMNASRETEPAMMVSAWLAEARSGADAITIAL